MNQQVKMIYQLTNELQYKRVSLLHLRDVTIPRNLPKFREIPEKN